VSWGERGAWTSHSRGKRLACVSELAASTGTGTGSGQLAQRFKASSQVDIAIGSGTDLE